MDRKERDKKIAELKQILADIKKLPWKTAPEELNNLKEYKKVLKSHGDVANKKQLHNINSSIKKYHNKLMSRKGGAKGVGSVYRGKQLLERKPGVGKLRKHNKGKIQLSAARQAQIEKDFAEAAKHAGVKNFGDILITSGFRSHKELKKILKDRMQRFAPLFKKYPNLKDPITDILVGIPNWKEVSKEIDKPDGKWYIRPTGTNLPPLKWKNRVDAQKGLKEVIDKEIIKKWSKHGHSPMGQEDMQKELLKANNLGLAQLNKTRDDFMGARSDHLRGKKFDIYQALFAHPQGGKMAQYLQDKKNYSFFQEYFPKTGSNVWDMRVPDPGEKSRSNFDFEAAFHKDLRPQKGEFKHEHDKSLPKLQKEKREEELDKYLEDQKGVLKGKGRKPWHKILAHEGEGVRTLDPVAAQYQAEHKKRKPKKKPLATKNKEIAATQKEIQEVKTELKSLKNTGMKFKERKAELYQRLADLDPQGAKSGRGWHKFAKNWLPYLPKAPSVEEVGIRETESIMAKPDEQAIRHFDREEGGDQKTNVPPVTPQKIQITATDSKNNEGSRLALGPKAGEVKVDAEEDFTFKGDDPKERVKEQIRFMEEAYKSTPEARASAADAQRLKVLDKSTFIEDDPTDEFIPPRQNLLAAKDGGEVKKYKTGELVETDEQEAEFFPGQKQQFQQNIGEEIVDQGETVTGDKPLMLSELKQSETLDPKPPVEPSFDQQGNIILTKQQEVEDVSTKSDQELKDNLEETLEVKSDPKSDTVTLSPRKSQVHRNKAYKTELDRRKQAADAAADAAVEAGRRETKSIMAQPKAPEVKVDLKEDVKVEETGDPKAFDLISHIHQMTQRNEEARDIMRNELAKANEAELNIQKVEPFRFWNSMSTPAKIVAGIGMLIGGYAAKDSPAGLQAVMNVIDGAVNADIQAQKLTQEQQLVVAKEATRRAKAAVDKYKAVATNPVQQAKLLELAQALETKKAGIAQKQQLQALKVYVMNQARAGKLHLVPPSLMRMVYPKEDMKRIDTMRTNYEKERKDRKIQPVLSAYRRMHNLISRKEDITGMDDIAIVFSFMKLLDPGSVVRESEFETAANAGPRAKWFARQWNRFITGGRFTESDRKGFLRSSLTLVKPALDEDKELQRKYVSMSRRYGYPAAFIIPPSTRYFDLPGTKDDAAIRKIMKEEGKTREEAEDIHHYVVHGVKSKRQLKREKPRYYSHKGVKYKAK